MYATRVLKKMHLLRAKKKRKHHLTSVAPVKTRRYRHIAPPARGLARFLKSVRIILGRFR